MGYDTEEAEHREKRGSSLEPGCTVPLGRSGKEIRGSE
jgi:hypothetical protein